MLSPNILGLNLLKIKMFKAVLHGFIEIVKKSKHQPNKLWVYQRREFYISPIQKQLGDDEILMYSPHNECKLVVAESFIQILKIKIDKKLTTNDRKSYLSYFNKLVD